MLLRLELPNNEIVSRGRQIARILRTRNAIEYHGSLPGTLEVTRIKILAAPVGERKLARGRLYLIEMHPVKEVVQRHESIDFNVVLSGAVVTDEEMDPQIIPPPFARSLGELRDREEDCDG